MKWYTHILGMLTVVATLSRFVPLTGLDLTLATVGSVAPDLIERSLRLRHRNKYVHNFLTGLTIFFLFCLVEPATYMFGLAYIHHLVLDITKGGVYIGSKKFRSVLNTLNPFHNAVVILFHILFLIALL